jgi:hypothetical protein
MGGFLRRILGFEPGAVTGPHDEFFGIILYVTSACGFAVAVASVRQ